MPPRSGQLAADAVRIGIDVGRTSTDAVLVAPDDDRILAEAKEPTTADVTSGIVDALRTLRRLHRLAGEEVRAVMLGTTHFSNALLAADQLQPTAAVRLGLPATASLPPFVRWPARLVAAIEGRGYLCHGGHEFDGRPLSCLDRDELRRVAEDLGQRGIRAVAVASVFSPVESDQERETAEILLDELPHLRISLSHEIGRMGLLERENATIINAALGELADRTFATLSDALAAAGVPAPLYLSQNDGTLMDLDYARRHPVATFASGFTNALRGAAFLAGITHGTVVDAGATTIDVGVVEAGYPREASSPVEVAGVRTNFRMPELVSLPCDGRDTALRTSAAVERFRTGSRSPVVVVGGGGALLPDRLGGAQVIRPDHFAAANAIGCATAQVGAEVDRIVAVRAGHEGEAAEAARLEAVERTVLAGADPATVKVLSLERVPIAYLPGNAVRVRVRATGEVLRRARAW